MFLRAATLFVLFAAIGCTRTSGSTSGVLPPMGLAVQDSVGGWCAEFAADSITPPQPGATASLVFVGDTTWLSTAVRIRARRTTDCPTAFGQPRWSAYAAYDVELTDPKSRLDSLPYLAMVIVGDTRWIRGDRGVVRGDLDGDGTPEELRRCAADEGEHFTLWSISRSGTRIRRWHEYFEWGVIVDPTCKPGENGGDTPK
jgi:hypothetical protein